MYKENKFQMEEEDSDPNRKTYHAECRKSSVEKVVLMAIIFCLAYMWVHHL